MSVLVKNMWMPDDCYECPMCHATVFKEELKSECYVLDKMCPDDNERLAECPLVDVGDSVGHDNICACNKYKPSAQPEEQHGRVFKWIVVEYPSYYIYPEYIGKPYFSIKYTENGQEFIGYGTYKPEVLSEYLKEYFMPSAQPDTRSLEQIKWERDIAIQQLKDLGYSLGEKIRTDGDTISRRAAVDEIEERKNANGYRNVAVISELNRLEGYIMRLPSTQPDIKQAAKLLSDFIESCPGGDSYLITPDGEELITDWGYATEGIQLIHDWAERASDDE